MGDRQTDRDRHRDTQRDRDREKQRQGEGGIMRERVRDRQTDRQTDREKRRERDVLHPRTKDSTSGDSTSSDEPLKKSDHNHGSKIRTANPLTVINKGHNSYGLSPWH